MPAGPDSDSQPSRPETPSSPLETQFSDDSFVSIMDDDPPSIEQAVAKLQAEGIQTQDQLKEILAAIHHLTQTQAALLQPKPHEAAQTQARTFSPVPAAPARSRPIKPAYPAEFDGDRTKGQEFLNSCQNYFRLCSEQFPDEQTKILWAMSYMKAGRAAKWTARIYRWEQLPENQENARFLDWADFRDEFRKEFTPAHSESSAISKLESTTYFQKGRPLDDYLDDFQDLIADSGYTDPKTVVVKFRRGLNTQIQNAIATMVTGRPADADTEAWYRMARIVDQNRTANEAFGFSQRAPAPTSIRPTGSVFNRPTPLPAAPLRHAPSTPAPGYPVPMDIDRSRPKAALPLSCFRCGKVGHMGRECPERFDVRKLSDEELEEILQERLMKKDVVDPADPPDADPTEREDFPLCSE